MNHIDEGTIHAWLDGALSVEEARAVESHVAQCAACSAAVAEARGLVAASSRILTALDDVPANVTPKRAPVAPVAKRQWRAAPWVTGIAATLMLAIGIATVNRGDRVESRAALDASVASERTPLVAQRSADSITVQEPVAEVSKGGTASGGAKKVATAGAARQPRSAQPAPPRSPETMDAASLSPAAPPPAAKSELARAEVALKATRADVAQSDTSVSRAGNIASDPVKRRQLGDSRVQLSEVVVTGMSESKLDTIAGTLRLAGCYKIGASDRQGGAIGVVQRAAGAAVSAASPPATARAAPSAPSAASSGRADFSMLRAPVLVRLDSSRNRVGFIARDQSSDSYLGTWSRIADDSVRVDLLAHGVFTIAAKDRLNCPAQ